MIADWDEHLKTAMAGVGLLGAESPQTVAGYHQLHAAGAQTDHLGAKVRELVCIAVAITTRCDACIANHVRKAVQLGATKAEIAEAAGVAVAMNAGAAITYAGHAMDVVASTSR